MTRAKATMEAAFRILGLFTDIETPPSKSEFPISADHVSTRIPFAARLLNRRFEIVPGFELRSFQHPFLLQIPRRRQCIGSHVGLTGTLRAANERDRGSSCRFSETTSHQLAQIERRSAGLYDPTRGALNSKFVEDAPTKSS